MDSGGKLADSAACLVIMMRNSLKTQSCLKKGTNQSFAVKGTRLPMVPDWKAALTVQYNFENQLWGASPYILGVYQYQGDSVNSLEGISSTLGENAVRKRTPPIVSSTCVLAWTASTGASPSMSTICSIPMEGTFIMSVGSRHD